MSDGDGKVFCSECIHYLPQPDREKGGFCTYAQNVYSKKLDDTWHHRGETYRCYHCECSAINARNNCGWYEPLKRRKEKR